MTAWRLPLEWKKQLRPGIDRLVEQKWINVGLRAKMGAVVLIGLVGLLTIFALLGISTSRQTTHQALSERLVLARLTAANLDATLSHVEGMLMILADQETLRDPQASPAEQVAALRTGFAQMAAFTERIYLLDASGQVLLSTAPTEEPNAGWTKVAVFEGPPQEWRFNLAVVPGDHPLIVITVPILDKAHNHVGFLAALLDLAHPKISPFKQPLDLGSTGTLDVVDTRGQILISTHPDRVMLNEEQDSLLGQLLTADEPMVETCVGCTEDDSAEPGDQIMAFAPLSQAPWGVLIRQEADEVFAPVRRLIKQTFVLGMVALLGALALVWVTTSSVIDPVQLLTEAAGRIASGDLTTPVSCRRGDEIGALALSFETMRVQLKRSIEEIQAWNRDLDGRVRERTQMALAAQLEAQRARDDLRAIIDGLSDELVVIGPDCRIQQMNRAAQRRCADGESMIGRYCYELFHAGQPCQAPDCECPIPRLAETGEAVKMTHVHLDPATGQERYMDIVASPMVDESGDITRIIELMRDVTDEKQTETSLVRRNQQLSLLNAVATTVNQSLDLEAILGQTLDEVLRLTGVDVGAVFLQKEMVNNLELMAHRGLSEEAAQLAAGLGLLDGSCGGVMEAGQVIVVPDIARYRGRRADSLRREKLCTLVHVPLVVKGFRLGSICVGTRCQREFDSEEQELLTALANQVAVAVENARLYAEVQHKEQMRGELLKKVITAQEEERKRIARELHDDTSQIVTALLYASEEAMEMEALDEIKEQLGKMHRLAGQTLTGVHKLIFDLRPTMLDHLGLVPALRWFAQSRLEPLGARVTIEENSTGQRLPAEIETVLFRVVQEAINNTARHSGARNVRITFQMNEEAVTVTVEDDGIGFDMVETTLSPDTRCGLGLMGMRERVELLGGDMEITTAPGFGTKLCLHLPLAERGMIYA